MNQNFIVLINTLKMGSQLSYCSLRREATVEIEDDKEVKLVDVSIIGIGIGKHCACRGRQ